MAHFAKLDDNNTVLAVHVVNNDAITVNGVEVEQIGIDFLTQLHGHTNWKQTSYNGTFRKKYAGIGDTYDPVNDVFIEPQPYPSWSLDENFEWKPPVDRPDGQIWQWIWDEDAQNWVEVTF